MAKPLNLVLVFARGTLHGGLVLAVAGFLGFGIFGGLLEYFDLAEAIPIAMAGTWIFGLLGLLGGGMASVLHELRSGKKKEVVPTL